MAQAEFSVAGLVKAMEGASLAIKGEVSALIGQAATTTVARVQRRYPKGPTGTLQQRVFVTRPRQFSTSQPGAPSLAKLVRATAPHVHLWQEGSRERFDATRGNARRGRMPAGGRVFEAIAADERRRMLTDAERVIQQRRTL